MQLSSQYNKLDFFNLIEAELSEVHDYVNAQLSSLHEPVNQLLGHVNTTSGKMLRPGLVLLSGLCFGPILPVHITVAAIVEMVHDATLLHDDVIDEGDTRRGKTTVNRLFSNETAILAGDLLLSRASVICSSLDCDINKIIACATSQVCEGELAQLMQRDNFQLTESEYIKIISQKTAALFSGCCKLGAVCSKAPEYQVEALNKFGENIGIAFQITDDLLDIVGNEDQTGKTAGRDADKNKLTLSLIHQLSSVGEKEKRVLIEKIENSRQDRKVLVDILSNNGSLEYAGRRAGEFADLAIASLADIADSPAKQALLSIAKFVTNRVA